MQVQFVELSQLVLELRAVIPEVGIRFVSGPASRALADASMVLYSLVSIRC